MMKKILLSLFAVFVFAGYGLIQTVHAEQSSEVPADVQKWEIELYSQKFTLIPSLYNDAEQEGGPAWEKVRHHVRTLLPDAFTDEHELSRQEVLDGIKKFRGEYNDLLYKEVRRLSVELVEKHPKFYIAGDEELTKRYEEFEKKQDKSYRIDRMEFAIAELFKSNTWRDQVKTYREESGNEALSHYYFANAYTFFEYAFALEYLYGMLEASPEMQSE